MMETAPLHAHELLQFTYGIAGLIFKHGRAGVQRAFVVVKLISLTLIVAFNQ